MKKLFLSLLVAATGLTFFLLFALSRLSTFELIICSADEGGFNLPSWACELHLKKIRGNGQGLDALNAGGLDPVLNLNSTKKYELADFLISQGMSVDAPNQIVAGDDATPLHLSVLYNDLERAKFLLSRGANPSVTSEQLGGRTPLELARHLQLSGQGEDRTALVHLLAATPPRNK